MWYVYILSLEKINKYYIGCTDRLSWRLQRHNMGWGKFTRRGIPWRIVYTKSFPTKKEALRRERFLKRMKSRTFIENLIRNTNAGGRPEDSGSLVDLIRKRS